MENSSSQLETRVTRLETHMEHMASNFTRILEELKDFRTYTEKKFEAVDAKFERVNERISALHASMNEKFGDINAKFGEINAKFGDIKVWALTLLGGGLGFGILTVVARALHWI